MFNIDIEKKLNDLSDGTYYKTLNGKSYEIQVKNIENNNKLIHVYCNKNLIIHFNYYKDGKVEVNNMIDNKSYTLKDIIEKMISLSEGYAELDNMSILVKESKKIDENSSTTFKVEIEDDKYFYIFNIPYQNEYYINIKSKNNDFELFSKKDRLSKEGDNRTLTFINKDKKYALTNKCLTNLNDEKKYNFYNNTLINKIDDKYMIGYSFDNYKIYLYTKKNNAVGNNLENDYIKIAYTKGLAKAGNFCFDFIDSMKNKIKEKIDDKDLNGLLDSIKLEKTNINFDLYYDDINEMAELYQIYNHYLNLLDNEEIINSIKYLVDNANITLFDKKINEFKGNINNNSLKDLNTLYELRKQLREIIKLKKKQNRTKKKIFKNTDIEN